MTTLAQGQEISEAKSLGEVLYELLEIFMDIDEATGMEKE